MTKFERIAVLTVQKMLRSMGPNHRVKLDGVEFVIVKTAGGSLGVGGGKQSLVHTVRPAKGGRTQQLYVPPILFDDPNPEMPRLIDDSRSITMTTVLRVGPEPKPEPIERFAGEEGMEARMFDLGERGFSVTLVDTDSGETVPTYRFFKDRDAAIAYAEEITTGGPAEVARCEVDCGRCNRVIVLEGSDVETTKIVRCRCGHSTPRAEAETAATKRNS